MCVRLYRLQPKISYTKELFFFLDLEIYQRKKIRTKSIKLCQEEIGWWKAYSRALGPITFFLLCEKTQRFRFHALNAFWMRVGFL